MTWFLGANTPRGFASFYGGWTGRFDRLFIIKGTPGNGKSGFMRRVAAKLEAEGYGYEAILCSGDPQSWDGVCFPELRTAFVDGTAPHIIEPEYPLAVESYLPLTQFIDDAALRRERDAVVSLQKTLKEYYAHLTRILRAVGELRDERDALVKSGEAAETLRRRARGIIRRELGSKAFMPSRYAADARRAPNKRFIEALTPDGTVTLWDTVGECCGRVYALHDGYRQAEYILLPVMEAALAAGREVIACYDPFAPERVKHLLLPELGLGFVTLESGRNAGTLIMSDTEDCHKPRPLRLDAAIPGEILKQHRLRLRFLKKTGEALTDDARGVLSDIRRAHDALEAVYNPHVDFTGLRALADAYAGKLSADHRSGKG